MEEERNCAFQYAKMENGIFKNTVIVCDKYGLSLSEAKQYWNEYFSDCAKWIAAGNTAEMVIWIDMETPHSYRDTLEYISTMGVTIWYTKRNYFTTEFI